MRKNSNYVDLLSKFGHDSEYTYVVVGDIHGCYDELVELYNTIVEQYGSNTRFISCGDIVDRGTKVRQTIEFVRKNFYGCVLGNHEDKMLRWAMGNSVSIGNGLKNTIDECGGWLKEKEQIDWFSSLPHIFALPIEGIARLIVHAGINPRVDIWSQYKEDSIYIRGIDGKNYFDVSNGEWTNLDIKNPKEKIQVIYGHIVQTNAPRITKHDNATYYGIDGGCVHGGKLIAAVFKPNEIEPEFVVVQAKSDYVKSMEVKTNTVELKDTMKNYELITNLMKRVDDKLISVQDLQGTPYRIFNYTQKTTFGRAWDEYTLMSRGLIIDMETGDIIARPFDKFFNINEVEDTQIEKLPLHEEYEVYDKADGSLGILFYDKYSNMFRIATRGSFNSDQAIWATKWFNEQIAQFNELNESDMNVLKEFVREETLLFEIIVGSINTNLVLKYPFEGLVFLAMRNINTGTYADYDVMEKIHNTQYMSPRIKITARYDNLRFEEIDEMSKLLDNIEGWVIKFKNGMRVKVKTDWYKSRAKVIAHCTPLNFWENMKYGKVDKAYLEVIPEEFVNLRDKYVSYLEGEYVMRYYSLLQEVKAVKSMQFASNADWAAYINGQTKHKGILFNLTKEKSPDDMAERIDAYLMKLIRPDGNKID
jgi:RNA ligase